jgi:hypothetical protein
LQFCVKKYIFYNYALFQMVICHANCLYLSCNPYNLVVEVGSMDIFWSSDFASVHCLRQYVSDFKYVSISFPVTLLPIFFYCFARWRYIVAVSKFLTMYQIHHTWIHPLHHSPLYHSPIPGMVSTGINFAFIYMCTLILHHIHPSTPFPHNLSPPTRGDPWWSES